MGSNECTHSRRLVLLVAAALIAAVVALPATASAQSNDEAGNGQPNEITISGIVTASGGMSTANVVVSVVARCWWVCSSGSPMLPGDHPERPHPLNPSVLLGETSVDSTGDWSIAVNQPDGPFSFNGYWLMVWDRNAELAVRRHLLPLPLDPREGQWESQIDIEIELEPGGQVSGQIVNPSGSPLPSGRYVLTPSGYTGYDLDIDLETGRFISPTVAPGQYRIAYGYLDGDYLTNNDAARVEVSATQTVDAGTIELQLPGQITGTVTDRVGRALSGVTVSGRISSESSYSSMPYSPFSNSGRGRLWATTGEDGTFTAQNLFPDDDWQIEIEVPLRQEFTASAAGETHSCSIRDDLTLVCWGNNQLGQTDAPDGQYTAIAAGEIHTCAIRDDNTIACWGSGWDGKTDPPDGQFTAIAAGGYHSCAIKTDATIACWGNNWDGQTDAPSGTYTAVAAGGYHSCAIRADATIACWGNNWEGQIDAPSGTYTAVAAGEAHSCAIRTDATIACWGNSQDGQATPHRLTRYLYTEDYLQRFRSSLDLCLISVDNWVFNVAPGHSDYEFPGQGSLADLCGRDVTLEFDQQGLPLPARELIDGTCRDCFRRSPSLRQTGLGLGRLLDSIDQGEIQLPDGQYTAISARWYHTCAIKTDGNITCWGNNSYKQADAPEGQYTAVTTGSGHSCAIRNDGSVVCWGSNSYNRARGPLQIYHPASREGIALASGGTVDCSVVWNENPGVTCSDGQTEPEGDSAAARCFAVHQFGAQPVDVAKSADRQTVLAQLSWGYHDSIGCYLTLDEAALGVLQVAPAPLGFPAADPDASQRCSAVHQFGAQPVDVAKSADRQTVLAQVRWGYHDSIGCYLALDTASTAALRAAHT